MARAKTTLILFYPLWPLMWIIYRWPDRSRMVMRDWLREAGMLAMRMLIGLYVLNLGYGFEGSLTPLKKFHFVSNLFTGSGSDTTSPAADSQELAPASRPWRPTASPPNRFADTWLGAVPVPFPKNYLLGIDIQQRDFEDYGRPSYLRGEWRDHGWWYYYLYAVAIKVPLGLWLLGLLALIPSLRHKIWTTTDRRPPIATFRDQFVLLFPAIVIFAVVSAKTGFNEHMRYVLPAFPFFFIAVSQVTRILLPDFQGLEKNCLTRGKRSCYGAPKSRWRIVRVLVSSATLVSACWFFASSLSIWPHSLSYANEVVGGPVNLSKHLLGSSGGDWGADLRYLEWTLERFDNAPKWIAYFGCYDPSKVGLECDGPPPDVPNAELLEDIPGLYAVSINFVFGYPWHATGAGRTQFFDHGALSGFRQLVRSDSAAYSIGLYIVAGKTPH